MNSYHFCGKIGEGKHSTVYKGRKKKTIQYYAIKSVEKSQKPRVLQEVRTLHSLNHDNVLKFYAWYETTNHLWLILEYCVGGDLLTLLRQDNRLPEESIHDFARDLVKALQYLHSNSVVYCDLKPSNILLDENGRLKLCDFGLALRLSEIGKTSAQQLPQAKRGTPAYMAPELLEEGGVHSFESDLWALGCVVYECYAGRPPFVSNSFAQLVSSILSDPPAPLPGDPSPEFQDLVFRLLQKNPVHRIQWEELRAHPFWRVSFKPLPLPHQPVLENFLKQRPPSLIRAPPPPHREGGGVGADSGTRVALGDVRTVDRNAGTGDDSHGGAAASERQGQVKVRPLRELSQNTNPDTNVLRLSRIVRTNLQRDTEDSTYQSQGVTLGNSEEDITLENHDLELDFAERPIEAEGGNDAEEERESGGGGPAAETQASPFTAAQEASSSHSHSHHSRSSTSSDAGDVGPNVAAEKGRENLVAGVKGLPSGGSGLTGRVQAAVGTPIAKKMQKPQVQHQGVPSTPPIHQLRRQEREQQTSPLTADKAGGAVKEAGLSLAKLLWHDSELTVKQPIMLNRRIEKLAEPSYDPRQLAVPPFTAEALVAASREQVEDFIASIMKQLSPSNSVAQTEKVNILRYLETVCSNRNVANLLINSSLMHFLVKLLRTSKLPTLRVQLIVVMGVLIRHATVIQEELAASGIVNVLSECLRDRVLRRRAMASLGELIFYIATQNKAGTPDFGGTREAASQATWQVPATTISLVTEMLKKGEDEVTQHYAVKTIENVSSEGGEWAARFASAEVITNLCQIYRHANSKQEHLKLTAGNSLVRILRFGSSWNQTGIEKLGVKELLGGLAKGTVREQQIHINIINLGLSAGGGSSAVGKNLSQLIEDKVFIPTVVSLLDNASEVIRGKAALCAALLCRTDYKFLLACCNSRLIPALERLNREKDEYVRGCVDFLIQTMVDSVHPILARIVADMERVGKAASGGTLGRKGTVGVGAALGAQQQLKSSLALFPVLLHLITSGTCRGRVVDEEVVRHLASFLGRMAPFQGQEEFLQSVMHVLEVLSQQPRLLLLNRHSIQTHLIRNLIALHARAPSGGDLRFLCLKIFCDILGVYLEESAKQPGEEAAAAGDEGPEGKSAGSNVKEVMEEKASGNEGNQGEGSGAVGAGRPQGEGEGSFDEMRVQLEDFVKRQVLSLYPAIMEDEDPIPLYAQKLLVALLDHQWIHEGDIDSLQLTPQLFSLLCSDSAGFSAHSLRLCLALASSPEVETRALSELKVVDKLGNLLDCVCEEDMDDFIQPILALCQLFLERDRQGSTAPSGGEETARERSGRTESSQRGEGSRRRDSSSGGGGGSRLRGDQKKKGAAENCIQDIGDFANHADLFLELTGSEDADVAESAGECLCLVMSLSSRAHLIRAADHLLRNAILFADLLANPTHSHSPDLVTKLQLQLLKVLGASFKLQQQHELHDVEGLLRDFESVGDIVIGLREHRDKRIARAADDVAYELEQL